MTQVPLGRQGFNSADEAAADATQCLGGLEYAVVRRDPAAYPLQHDDFAWIYPVSYAEHFVKECNATIVARHTV